MNKIQYYVAISLDGFICGKDEDISGFHSDGNGVQKYLADLQGYKTVIMGRKTYEFGYKFGLQPGEPAYPHMDHYIFSNNLHLKNSHPQVKVKSIDLHEIKKIREDSKTDIYLCGGGIFAGWLLENQQVDILKLKINPIILGQGIKLFGDSTKSYSLQLLDSAKYQNGLLINSYEIKY